MCKFGHTGSGKDVLSVPADRRRRNTVAGKCHLYVRDHERHAAATVAACPEGLRLGRSLIIDEINCHKTFFKQWDMCTPNIWAQRTACYHFIISLCHRLLTRHHQSPEAVSIERSGQIVQIVINRTLLHLTCQLVVPRAVKVYGEKLCV